MKTSANIFLVSLLAVSSTGCGGGGDSDFPYQAPGTSPSISNLEISQTSAVHNAGDGRIDIEISVDFIDQEGDVNHMSVNVLDGSGAILYVVGSSLSLGGSTSGTASGTVQIVTDTLGDFTLRVWLVDETVRASNKLDAQFSITASAAQSTWYKDADRDGYSDGVTVLAAERPAGHYLDDELTATKGDCDDSDNSVHPGGTEIDADGVDQDCNGFEISGPPELVFDWSSDRCEDLDIPDLPARAFRDKDGQVQLISSHANTRRFVGPDLDNVVRDCTIVMTSHFDPNPSMFNDVEWIGAIYTEDGNTIYAIVHNEFEGWTHPGYCSRSYWTADCWYNGLTLAVSTDGGLSYGHPVSPPDHLIAASSIQYEIDRGPDGIFHPSSILRGPDGYYYAMVHRVRQTDANPWHACLMRTPDLANPDAWRFWDGAGYEGEFINPYTDAVSNPDNHDCSPIDRDAIWDMTQSLTYNEYLGRYVLTGSATSIDGTTHGFFVSFSEDMIDWTPRELLLERALPWTVQNANEPHYLYPSLLDPESTARSFDKVAETAYLYYTRNNRAPGDLDRDMLRAPVTFFRH